MQRTHPPQRCVAPPHVFGAMGRWRMWSSTSATIRLRGGPLVDHGEQDLGPWGVASSTGSGSGPRRARTFDGFFGRVGLGPLRSFGLWTGLASSIPSIVRVRRRGVEKGRNSGIGQTRQPPIPFVTSSLKDYPPQRACNTGGISSRKALFRRSALGSYLSGRVSFSVRLNMCRAKRKVQRGPVIRCGGQSQGRSGSFAHHGASIGFVATVVSFVPDIRARPR